MNSHRANYEKYKVQIRNKLSPWKSATGSDYDETVGVAMKEGNAISNGRCRTRQRLVLSMFASCAPS